MKTNYLDLRFILANPFVYRLFSTIVGQGPARDIYVKDYIRPQKGDRILDIGCGPADILEHLPDDVYYTGFDMSRDYIDAARERFGPRGVFLCKLLSPEVLGQMDLFDLVIAVGVLHHLDDANAAKLFELAQKALKPGGRLITIDPVFLAGQPWLEHFLVSKDRGNYVRYDEEYRQLIPPGFQDVKTSIRQGMLRMPYSLMFMECTR